VLGWWPDLRNTGCTLRKCFQLRECLPNPNLHDILLKPQSVQLRVHCLDFCFGGRVLLYDTESIRRSQWPRGLRHELSSPARTLGSWVRIPPKARMSACVYSVSALSVRKKRPYNGLTPRSKESYRRCKKIKKLKKAVKVQHRALER
jgi:hypothetical protein